MRLRSFAAAGGAAFLLTACAAMTPQVTVERDLIQTDKAFSQMSAQQGMAAAFLAYMDPREGLMVRPGGLIEGAQQFQDAFAATPPGVTLTWEPDRAYASTAGDFGVTSGRFTRSAAGRATAQGRYVTVWRRDSSGQWKALIDIGNTDPATDLTQPPVVAAPSAPYEDQGGPQSLQPPPQPDPSQEPTF